MSSVIFNGPDVKTLKPNLKLGENARIMSGDSDNPTLIAKDAPAGSIYIRTDGRIYKKTDAGSSTNWEEIINQGINYILNTGAELDTSGWTTYDDGAVATPIDGAGGTPASTLTRFTGAANVIRGNASFNWAKATTDQQGTGFAYDFSIDLADLNNTLVVSFEHRQNSANYSHGDIRVFVYDIDNATLLGIVDNGDNGDLPVFLGTSPVTSTKFTGQFQATDSQNYRLIFHTASTELSTYNMHFDDVKISPDVVVPGAIAGDSIRYISDGSGQLLTTGYSGVNAVIGFNTKCMTT